MKSIGANVLSAKKTSCRRKKFPLSKGSAAGVSRILHCAEIREKCADNKQKNYLSIVDNLKTKEENQDVVWHRYCYSDFTSEGHIKRVLKKQEPESKPDGKDAPASEPSRRSSVRRSTGVNVSFARLT